MSDPLAAMTDPYVPETTPALHPAGRFVGAMPLVRADQRIAPIDDAVSRDRIGIVPQREDDASLSSARRDQLASTRRFLLVFRFALFNLAALALLGAVYLQGWIDTVLAADGTGLSVAIFATFLAGLLVSARKSWRLSTELDCVRNFNPCRESWASTHLADIARRSAGSRAITASVLRAKVTSRIAVVRHVANSLVLLGLIGTVIGFIIALSGVEPDAAGGRSCGRADGRRSDQRHVGGALHHPGRRGAEPVAYRQLPHPGRRARCD